MKLFAYILCCLLLCSGGVVMPFKKTVIGSAWREAIEHVYIRSADNNTPSVKPTAYVSPEPPEPEPPVPAPEQSIHYPPAQQAQMHIKEPSPEEMRLFFAQLEDIINNPDFDDDEDDDENDENFAALFGLSAVGR